ncbi:MAG: hypothetical protein A2900_00855 [Candidatus Chisholmbacteria bacterium RIFCSPLOWO2_01_FULL_50_28]|uniref:Uncharacterized protein n=1 Tax=Candidatus Chisholmbacteria bacterium RIFCSPHIGHO2_01_FULL_52_32 TaxID=1797591 RepID=A0A1G1VUF1_9BACT|nr:MAG: hypothetical protein A2786_05915 [Candidatus Chisholmbacteria bacterium RIFCSPHIGHO2_01_FULL_52_32]OGY19638.1 MAG: hypothetical protein A2900_00855 [Candidatus Chisholmbacteria bacterium RIFCSPLOWO2_01_FULL_50_28]
MTVEQRGYKTIGSDQVQVVLQAYNQTRSCERASMTDGVFCSSATVNRIVNAAAEEGVLNPGVKREKGRPAIERGHILDLVEAFPIASVGQIARLADVSENTVYRAKRGE